jgi:hypothetical protein
MIIEISCIEIEDGFLSQVNYGDSKLYIDNEGNITPDEFIFESEYDARLAITKFKKCYNKYKD